MGFKPLGLGRRVQAGDAMMLKAAAVSACLWGALYLSVAVVYS